MRAGWIGGLLLLLAGPAQAGLTLCNDGGARASVAIAYAADGAWASEGWWGIAPGACSVVQAGDLKQRHYYYALSGDAGFTGEGYIFCTQTEPFTLTGADGDCAALSGAPRDFAHIDTGADATDFTFRFAAAGADDGAAAAPKQDTPAPPQPASADDMAALNRLLAGAATPSFERGIMGEPFVVSAIAQGCEEVEGDRLCIFYAEGARWVAYDHGASNPAALAALAALPVGAPVDVSGDMISMGDITVEAAIASLTQGYDAFAAPRAAMQGLWVSVDDPQNQIEIYGSEQTDIYAGEEVGTSLLTLSDQCDEVQGGVLLRLQLLGGDPVDSLCYEVLVADGVRLELAYFGSGQTLIYQRP